MEILILLTCRSTEMHVNCFSFEARKFERVKANRKFP